MVCALCKSHTLTRSYPICLLISGLCETAFGPKFAILIRICRRPGRLHFAIFIRTFRWPLMGFLGVLVWARLSSEITALGFFFGRALGRGISTMSLLWENLTFRVKLPTLLAGIPSGIPPSPDSSSIKKEQSMAGWRSLLFFVSQYDFTGLLRLHVSMAGGKKHIKVHD